MIDYDKYKGHTSEPLVVEHPEDIEDYYSVLTENGGWLAQFSKKGDANLFADAPLLLARCLELEEENAALIHDNEDYVKTASELATENCDLREALTKIRGWREIGNAHTLTDFIKGIEKIADQALNKAKGGE